ncbi:MAG: methyltransferase RsmF C-terminal domain-like protein [Chitinophagaceae bacterium]
MLPEAFIQSIQSARGFQKDAFIQVHESANLVTSIRNNPFKKPHQNNHWSLHSSNNYPLQTEQVPWCDLGSYLSVRPSFTLDPVFHAGAYYVQEASSMYLWEVLRQIVGDNTADKKVLDLCAAPGGKTTLLGTYFKDGLVVSNEVIKQRVQILAENVTKWGMDNIVVTNNDPTHFQSLKGYFDVIVIDAPCSGSGMFRKDKQAIEEWSLEHVKLCSLRQQRIIDDVLPALKEGGWLIYSTCSYSELENENCVDAIINKHHLKSMQLQNPINWGIVETQSEKHKAFGYRFYPNMLKGEGFFIAALQKTNEQIETYFPHHILIKPSKLEQQQIQDFTQLYNHYVIFKQYDVFKAIQQKWVQDIEILAQCLYIKKAGVALGIIKGKDIVPQHEWAVSLLQLNHIPTIEVDKETALQYLKRKDVSLSLSVKGWNLIQYCGLFLGWVKVLPNRLNNYYPQEWRILKE